jgi:ubiquinone/menaquinone biosynthesis C-methylase UbiE
LTGEILEIKIKAKLKEEYQNKEFVEIDGIPVIMNEKYLSGDNEKYMKMYNWMSKGYDLAETVIGRIKYGNTIEKMRNEIISKLEWKNNASVLYVSIGTGKNLQFIPESIDKKSLDFTGADISIGMLKKCKKNYRNRLNLSLVNCCAEDLPFNDNEFDIVFHVGGINFFSDKKLAIEEMIRVAKKGTKILIADETADFIEKQYKSSSLSKKYYIDKTFDLNEIVTCIPDTVTEVKTELLWDERFYCITFKK